MPRPHSDFDVIVAGLGVFGAAAALSAAQRGVRVLGLDRLHPPHALGSSHGRTRIIREAYFEAPFYVPLVREAYRRWTALQEALGEELLRITGGLAIGPAEGELVAGALASVREHGIEHEVLDASELRRRFPALALDSPQAASTGGPDATLGVLESRAGVLMAERCHEALLEGGREAGATLRFGEGLEGWDVRGGEVGVRTPRATYRADRLVLALGPWLARHLGAPSVPDIEVERQVVHWFAPREDGGHPPPHGPATIWEHRPGGLFYVVPDVGEGVKAALHHDGVRTDPDDDLREATPADVRAVRDLLARLIPGAAGRRVRSSVCLYTNSRDRNLLVGAHPREPRVVLAGAGSGHGFKFAPVVGELAAACALGESSPAPPAELLPGRFSATRKTGEIDPDVGGSRTAPHRKPSGGKT